LREKPDERQSELRSSLEVNFIKKYKIKNITEVTHEIFMLVRAGELLKHPKKRG
jgi:hypothetical protein